MNTTTPCIASARHPLPTETMQDVKTDTRVPFLVRFASPVPGDGSSKPLLGTRHTRVERETTDDS